VELKDGVHHGISCIMHGPGGVLCSNNVFHAGITIGQHSGNTIKIFKFILSSFMSHHALSLQNIWLPSDHFNLKHKNHK
jgi:hypothetical protein